MKKLLGLCCVLAFVTCTKEKFAGSIDTTDTGIMGKASYSTGKAAANADVQLFKTLDTSKTALAQVSTDNGGSFTFDSLAPGSYNVWIESTDSQVAFIDSVYVPENTEVRRDAVLGKSGSITAIVGLQTGDDPRSVFVQALGTQKYSNVDSAGVFTIPGLAEGDYTLRLVSTIQGYTPTFKTITIASGVNDTLKDTIKLIYTGIPPVAGITAHYDPFTGIVTVSWSAMAYANLYDYLIYRDVPGSINLSTTPIAASIDTVFYDTLFGNPSTNLIGWPDASIGNSNVDTSSVAVAYRYRVTIRNKSNQEGLPYNFADISGTTPIDLMHLLSPNDNVKFTNVTNLAVSWNAVAQAQNYQVNISSKPDFSDTVFTATIKDTVKALPALALGYYYWHVRAQGPKGQWGFWSLPRRFVVNGGLFADTLGQSVNFDVDKLLAANDGGFLLIGSFPNNSNSSPYIVKTDSNGVEQWHQSYNLIGFAIDAFQTDDNGYLVLGIGPSFLLKISQNGTSLWSKTNFDSTFSTTLSGNSITKTPDNGFILSASYNISSTCLQNHVQKFDESGLKQWDQIIDTTNLNSLGPLLLPLGLDSFAFVDLQPCDLNASISDASIVYDTLKISIFDYTGNVKISQRISIPPMQNITTVCKTNKGEISVSGSSGGNLANFFVRISTDWNVVSTQMGGGGYGTIEPLPDGGFLHVFRPNPEYNNVSIVRADDAGSTIWSKNNSAGFSSFISEPDGSVVVAGNIISNQLITGVLLYKISNNGVSFEQ